MTANDQKNNLERYKKERNREINQMEDAEKKKNYIQVKMKKAK